MDGVDAATSLFAGVTPCPFVPAFSATDGADVSLGWPFVRAGILGAALPLTDGVAGAEPVLCCSAVPLVARAGSGGLVMAMQMGQPVGFVVSAFGVEEWRCACLGIWRLSSNERRGARGEDEGRVLRACALPENV